VYARAACTGAGQSSPPLTASAAVCKEAWAGSCLGPAANWDVRCSCNLWQHLQRANLWAACARLDLMTARTQACQRPSTSCNGLMGWVRRLVHSCRSPAALSAYYGCNNHDAVVFRLRCHDVDAVDADLRCIPDLKTCDQPDHTHAHAHASLSNAAAFLASKQYRGFGSMQRSRIALFEPQLPYSNPDISHMVVDWPTQH
jgi:hypothetical protein